MLTPSFALARRGAVAWLRGQVVRMTDAEREDDFQVVSLREAEKYEVNRFFEEVSRKALAAKRKPGQRGPQVAPTKQLVSVRYSPDVLAFFKASGAGWQSRMDDALKQWVFAQNKTKRRIPSEA